MVQNKRLAALLLLVGIVVAVVAGAVVAWLQSWQVDSDVVSLPAQSIEKPVETPQSVPAEPAPEPEPEPEPPIEFTVVAGGDMLIHMPVADSAWNGETWDFVPLMEPVAPYISGSSLALCNMETPIAGPGGTPTGYPSFAAPDSLVGDMARTGWNGCSTSTNHSLDRGFTGITNTLNEFDQIGLGHVGTARTEAESSKPQIYQLEEEGRTVTIAHISGAYDTNGIPLPEDAAWSWNQIDADRMIAEAKAARETGADMVIASAHCCEVEYTTEPEPYQIEVAQKLADSAEVDILISHHAHVPKTMELLPGGVNGEGMWVAYGLGNFISNQSTACCREETSTGLLAFFKVRQEDEGPFEVVDANWVGVTMDFTTGHRVRPLRADGVEGSGMGPDEVASRYGKLQAIMENSPATELMEPPTDTAEVTVLPRAG